ncbi:MAG: ArsR family transcriptional regulator [Rhizobiales bacterium 17-65-6]|jgi:ArsR family transcriptional regulator|uniref:ArsR/SmtB family transcription factor n=1 Tax=Xanthobacter flavus TaxID=281 RepID=UPI000BDA3C22|nr:MAG: ArsR family transcriptional regulator [Rhizobiales bacterium 12-66-7]OYY84608.1 MAG: ArsR family transcriptional regulator [Rhizobiales bacterium 35-66-30]OYZ79263.1 MAG: ArsR family transcriptional regulator [Rhizobiales bacterium 24-66-13]OYZ96152.1 MAG: ArsR family transcriptional regulator [Rhizobiales bacterium 17-65-6]OZB08419.1 MAG: ArsR family transcriptional regulator [Rhizobiales bacterium 39-66-18]HQS49658.1 metalloregulator ArsR/SmtB family transcription factor [Xanthobacte
MCKSTDPKRALFAELATVARALGHEHRVELLEHLAQGERSVEALARLTGLSMANASQHLQQLRRAGLLDARRDGKFILYRLADDGVVQLMSVLRQTAERNVASVGALLARYFDGRDGLEPVGRAALVDRAQAGLVTVIDVRPREEFDLGHVPGAVSVPLEELDARLAEFDPATEIVAYCRGAYCLLAVEAVARLRARGFSARRMEDGMPEWRAAGLPVASG